MWKIERFDNVAENTALEPPRPQVRIDPGRIVFTGSREKNPIVYLAIPFVVLFHEKGPEAVFVLPHFQQCAEFFKTELLANAQKNNPVENPLGSRGYKIGVTDFSVAKNGLGEFLSPHGKVFFKILVEGLAALGLLIIGQQPRQ